MADTGLLSDWEMVDATQWTLPPINDRWYRYYEGDGDNWPYDVCRLENANGYWLIPAEDMRVNEDQTNLIGPYASIDEAKETADLLGRFLPKVLV